MKHFLLLILLTAPLVASAQTPALEVNVSNTTRFQVNTDGGVLATGSPISAIPATGSGYRMMWYPQKSAFRAGYVSSTQWDEANVGYTSVAFGYNTTASGYAALAAGVSTTATGDYAVALGHSASAPADYSMATGFQTTANGFASTAMGRETTASGAASIAAGFYTEASGTNAVAMGNYTVASGANSTALGSNTTASGVNATALGSYTTAQSYATLAIGRHNTVSGSASTWIATDPLFVAGNGTSSGARSDAFVLYKNGDILGTGKHTIRMASGGSRPHLLLSETNASGFARLRFGIHNVGAYWDVAGGNTNVNELNFFSPARGNVLSLRATGTPLVAYNGASLSAGGTWTNSSDSTKKAGFAAMDADAVLQKLADLRVTRWHYKNDPQADHVGPMAQDFHAAFGLGSDETSIATVDADGVLMLAVQALEKRNRELEDRIAMLEMEKEVLAYGINNVGDTLAARIAELETRLAALAPTSAAATDKP